MSTILPPCNLQEKGELSAELVDTVLDTHGGGADGSRTRTFVVDVLDAVVHPHLVRQVEEELGALPAEAQKLRDTKEYRPGAINDDHKQLIVATAQYVVRAAPYAHVSNLVKSNVRQLLGLGLQFTHNLGWAGMWDYLQMGLRSHLRMLGARMDDVFCKMDLEHRLGGYDPQLPDGGGGGEAASPPAMMTAGASPCAAELPQFVPAACRAQQFSGDDDVVAHSDLECTYIHFLRLLAMALDEPFRKHVNAAFEKAGVHLVGGGVSSGGIKGYERMRNKMLSPEDHGRLARPRPAHNVDIVRCLATFRTVEDMVTGLEVVRQHVYSQGGYVKFKNGMAWSRVFAESRFHMRVILGTGKFAFPARLRIGDLRAAPEVQRLWSDYLETNLPSAARGTWKRHVETALQWLDAVPANEEVSLLCEVQMLLQEYAAVRTAMHELYKIVRADTAHRLQADFGKYVSAREAEATHHRAGDTKLKLVCRDGTVDVLEELLARGDVREAEEVAAALEVACQYVRAQCVKRLLAYDGVQLSRDQLGAALVAATQGCLGRMAYALDRPRTRVVEQLLQAKAGVDTADAILGGTPTAKAASNGFVDAIRVLAQANADVDKAGNDGATPAFLAARQGHADVLEVLGEAKADVNKSKIDGHTPVFMAAQEGHAKAVQALVRARADVNKTRQRDGTTPACMAAQTGHADALQVLVQANADVRKARANGATPSFQAAMNGHEDALQVLVQAKVDVDEADAEGCTPAFMAAMEAHVNVLQVLVQAKADVDKAKINGATPAYIAAQEGNTVVLKVLVHAKADVDKAKVDGTTPAAMAAREGHTDALQVLVQANADVNKAHEDGATPAFMAAQEGHTDALQVLVQANADVDRADEDGSTPVCLAARRGHADALQVLVQAKADVDQGDADGVTPVSAAAGNGYADALLVLVQAGADVDAADTHGATPAHVAAEEGHTNTLQVLLQASVDLAKADADGTTPAALAAREGLTDVLRLLVQGKVDVDDEATASGATPAFLAAQEGHADALLALCQAKADVNKADADGATPTLAAAEEGRTAALQVLVQAKADVNEASADTFTPAFQAAARGHADALQILLIAKAKMDLSACAALVVLIAAAAGRPLPQSVVHAEAQALARLGLADAVAAAASAPAPLSQPQSHRQHHHDHRAFPETAALVRMDCTGTTSVLVFGAYSTITLDDAWRAHPRNGFYRVEVVAAGTCPQLGFATSATALPFEAGAGTGDDIASVAIDGVRQLLWCGGPQDGYYDHSWMGSIAEDARGGTNGIVVGVAVDLDARCVAHYLDGQWHDQAVPTDFDFEAEAVFPSLSAAGAVFRLLEVGPWAGISQ